MLSHGALSEQGQGKDIGNLACHIALVDVNGDIGLDIVGIVISTGFHALAQGNKDGLAIVPKAR